MSKTFLLDGRPVPFKDNLPRLDDEPRRRPRDELEAQRPRRLLGLARPQREEEVVQVDRHELARHRRQRRRGLDLQEAAQRPLQPGHLAADC